MRTCRICLKIDVKMYYLGETEEKKFIQDLFTQHGYNFQNLEQPHYACFECIALLKKTYKFVSRALKAQHVLRNIFENHKKVTLSLLQSINREEHGLDSSLSCSIPVFTDVDVTNECKNVPEVNVEKSLVEIKIEPFSPDDECDNTIAENTEDFMAINENRTKYFDEISNNSNLNSSAEDMFMMRNKSIKREDDDDFPPDITYDGNRHIKKEPEDVDYEPHMIYDASSKKKVKKRKLRVYPMKCEMCSYEIQKSADHWKHYLFTHSAKEYPHKKQKNYKCSLCGVGKNKKGQLQEHMLIHGEKTFECHICHKMYHTKRYMARHLKRVHGNVKLICDFCSKSFANRVDIVRHIRIHTGEKPYKCHICDARFAIKGNVGIHIRSKHRTWPMMETNSTNNICKDNNRKGKK
ncbi:zinc finger protein 765-like [Galleria mellonella]|uniref:Zinc finger protein 765-like n=1 Tax=Galleria mellonella TaxID=7137 RepID=A0ABM3MR70_GALME|nr:zinc finger protein 765-like [Galleria mellonella]